jgi:hypothetical protein
MCDEWLNSFDAFKEWALQSGYERGLTIDRIDNDGNYEPSNCRWATTLEQNNNRKSNRIETFNGDTDTVANLCRKYGRNYLLVVCRLQQGHTIDEAMKLEYLESPNLHKVEYKGETRTVSEWTRELGFKRNTLSERLRKGWSVEKAFETPVGGHHG